MYGAVWQVHTCDVAVFHLEHNGVVTHVLNILVQGFPVRFPSLSNGVPFQDLAGGLWAVASAAQLHGELSCGLMPFLQSVVILRVGSLPKVSTPTYIRFVTTKDGD
jgi:hypothetical protein